MPLDLSMLSPNVPEAILEKLSELRKNYDIEKLDENGANGYVFIGLNKILNARVAIKCYYWGGDKRFHLEPKYLMEIKSPHVLKVLDAGYIDEEWAYFTTPFCEGGSLDSFLKNRRRISLIESIDFALNILNGLSFLHATKLIHRDIKPGNIFIDDGRPVIGDFGSIVRLPDGQEYVNASQHSIIFTPPEAITENKYGFSGDIYQCGIVLYQLLGGKLPYDEKCWLNKKDIVKYLKLCYPDNAIFAKERIKERIKNGELIDLGSMEPWVSKPLKNIVRRACNVDPGDRFRSIAEFMIRLQEVRSKSKRWSTECGKYFLDESTRYWINASFPHEVKKRKNGPWRRDNALSDRNDYRSVINILSNR